MLQWPPQRSEVGRVDRSATQSASSTPAARRSSGRLRHLLPVLTALALMVPGIAPAGAQPHPSTPEAAVAAGYVHDDAALAPAPTTVPSPARSQLRANLAELRPGVSPGTASAEVATPSPETRDSRIFGGGLTSVEDHPWTTLVLATSSTGGVFSCTGVVLQRDVVLTAAHCVDNIPTANFTVFAGLDDVAENNFQLSGVATVGVPAAHTNGPDGFDVAVLFLTSPFQLGPKVQPIPVATASEVAAASTAVIAGWGATVNNGQSSNRLRSGTVAIIDDATCDVLLVSQLVAQGDLPAGSTPPFIFPATEICAGGLGADTCQGDSGGPLVIGHGTSPKLAGLTSYGPDCGVGAPGVYAELSSEYLYDFIAARTADISLFTPITPVRIFDTRNAAAPAGALEAGATIDVQIAGLSGIPSDVSAVVMNLTGTQAARTGYVTTWPTGDPRPLASSLNLVEGQTAPNMVIVPVGDGGRVSFFSSGGTHLLGDVSGYFLSARSGPGGNTVASTPGSRLVSLTPTRLFDTRTAVSPSGLVQAGSTLTVPVLGQAGIPQSNVTAIVLNLTGTSSRTQGFVTAFPANTSRPLASVLNFERTNDTTANLTIVPVGAGGISFFSSTTAHLLADVVGYMVDDSTIATTFDINGAFVPVSPARLFDTRTLPSPLGSVSPGGTVSVSHTGRAGIPNFGIGAVSLNLTATNTTPGYITGYPAGQARPVASSLNLSVPGETRANAAILSVGVSGGINYFASGNADLVADANGFFIELDDGQ